MTYFRSIAAERRMGEGIPIFDGTRLKSKEALYDTADCSSVTRLGVLRAGKTVKSRFYSSLQFEFRYRWTDSADRVTAVSF